MPNLRIPRRFRHHVVHPADPLRVRLPPPPPSMDPELASYFRALDQELNRALRAQHTEELQDHRLLSEWSDRLPYATTGVEELDNDTPGSPGVDETWDAPVTIMANPRVGTVTGLAVLMGSVTNSSGAARTATTFLEYSVDGGGNWASPGLGTKRARSTFTNNQGDSIFAVSDISGFPTDDIMLRGRIQRSASNVDWSDGVIGWILMAV